MFDYLLAFSYFSRFVFAQNLQHQSHCQPTTKLLMKIKPENRFVHHGQRTIDSITANATSHRLESAKAWKQLTFGTGPLSKQGEKWAQINKFNTARRAAINQDLISISSQRVLQAQMRQRISSVVRYY